MTPPPHDPLAAVEQGYASQDTGQIGELTFDLEVFTELRGISEKASSDSQPYDRTVYFGPRSVAVQVRARNPKNEGEWEFALTKGNGPRSDRRRPYRHDANYFALYCMAGVRVVARYFIPALLLEGRTTLLITPGRRRQRVHDFDPERFREAWRVLLDEMPPPLPKLPKPEPTKAPNYRRPSKRKVSVSPHQTALSLEMPSVRA